MKAIRRIIFAAAILAASISGAQPAAPQIGFVYPAGGQQGATLRAAVGGQNLIGTSAALMTGGGVVVRVLDHERPLTQKEINDLREDLQRLQDKRAAGRREQSTPTFTPADEKRAAEIRSALASRGNRQATVAIAETVTVEITLAPGATPGERELRLKTPAGLSNPLVFCVGQLPEIAAPVTTSTSARASRASAKVRSEIALPSVVNGQLLPGEVDRFRFAARRGQRLTFAVSARSLIPYLADAVPGWIQATIAIRDERGRELAYADDYRFSPDPALLCEIPADGHYTLEIQDALFRGREDFVYRIVAGELPFITGVFPLGGVAGQRTRVELHGWNLPRKELVIDGQGRNPGLLQLALLQDGRFSNAVRFALTAPVDCGEAVLNEQTAETAELALPVTIDGRIERSGDEDVFRFHGRVGEKIVAKVLARRLGSPLDSVLTLKDEQGVVVATNDDAEDKAQGLLTHHADSEFSVILPRTGQYSVQVADAQRQGGPEHGYRLRVGAPRPDFELRVVPSAINLRAGATVPVTVYALRRDGFSGEITLALSERGSFALSGARIPAGESQVSLTITATAVREELSSQRLFGRASIAGTTVTRPAVPADDRMQAFAYRHLVPAQELRVNISGRGTTLRPVSMAPLVFGNGLEPRIRIATTGLKKVRNLRADLLHAPAGIAVGKITHAGDVVEICLLGDPAQLKPGAEGNVILQVFGDRSDTSPGQSGPRASRAAIGTVPAIPFKVRPDAGT